MLTLTMKVAVNNRKKASSSYCNNTISIVGNKNVMI